MTVVEDHADPASRTGARRRIALVAHDGCKERMVAWARRHRGALAAHDLVATGTTGALLCRELGLDVTCLASGALGGDLQLGAAVTEGRIDLLVFLWDPLEAQPHDADVRALLRIATLQDVPLACNVRTADAVIASFAPDGGADARRPDHDGRRLAASTAATSSTSTSPGTSARCDGVLHGHTWTLVARAVPWARADRPSLAFRR